jgi:antitoxin component YwqK of YwqJK toxin-antitoxin module
MNYNNRKFRTVSNTRNGDVGNETIFYYKQEQNRIIGDYSGGSIVSGHLMGIVNEDGTIEFLYHHQNTDGVLMAGKCKSTPTIGEDGKLQLKETWKWLTGDLSEGESLIEEITREAEQASAGAPLFRSEFE